MFTVRLFTGLSLPPGMIANFEALLGELEPLARIRWSLPSNLHITTKFIGDWEFSRMPELARLLWDVEGRQPFPITARGLEFFSGPQWSRVLVAGVEASEPLRSLVRKTEARLSVLEVPREGREYSPHITIGRIPGPTPWPELDARVASMAEKDLGTFEAEEFHLFESTVSGYRKLATIPLK